MKNKNIYLLLILLNAPINYLCAAAEFERKQSSLPISHDHLPHNHGSPADEEDKENVLDHYIDTYRYNEEELASLFEIQLGERLNSFLLGLSLSEHQSSKKCTPDLCDWSRFAHERNLRQPTDPSYPCNWWDNYETYIDQLKSKVGINSLRISIEWCLVQPNDPAHYQNPIDSFDQNAIAHYAEVVAYLINQNITPVICFHHYTLPCWFADKGGFATIENCPDFANYCAYLYQKITQHIIDNNIVYDKLLALEAQQRSILWATFNSPEGVAFKGYRQHEGPPSNPEQDGLYWVTEVIKNMMEAHVLTYQTIKNGLEHNHLPAPKIGFLKNITQFDLAPDLSWYVKGITKGACAIARTLNDTCIYNFFTTGTFDSKIPLTCKIHHNQHAPSSLDWIGLNYYSNQHMKLFGRVTPNKSDPDATDNTNYRIYPYGLFRALDDINTHIAGPLNIPIYVTENGIATQDDEKRNRFYKEYFHELLRALAHDIPVHGILPWAAFDNYEWQKTADSNPQQSDNRRYGLTSVSPDGMVLTLKKGATYFRNFTFRLLQRLALSE